MRIEHIAPCYYPGKVFFFLKKNKVRRDKHDEKFKSLEKKV